MELFRFFCPIILKYGKLSGKEVKKKSAMYNIPHFEETITFWALLLQIAPIPRFSRVKKKIHYIIGKKSQISAFFYRRNMRENSTFWVFGINYTLQ